MQQTITDGYRTKMDEIIKQYEGSDVLAYGNLYVLAKIFASMYVLLLEDWYNEGIRKAAMTASEKIAKIKDALDDNLLDMAEYNIMLQDAAAHTARYLLVLVRIIPVSAKRRLDLRKHSYLAGLIGHISEHAFAADSEEQCDALLRWKIKIYSAFEDCMEQELVSQASQQLSLKGIQ